MKNSFKNQLVLDLACEPRSNIKLKSPNPFLLSERVKRILYKRGYSHIFNYPDFQYFKKIAEGTTGVDKAHQIADLFIENTMDTSDFVEYIN